MLSQQQFTLIGIAGIGLLTPNKEIIEEAYSAASDYFILYEKKSKMNLSRPKIFITDID